MGPSRRHFYVSPDMISRGRNQPRRPRTGTDAAMESAPKSLWWKATYEASPLRSPP